MSFEWIDLEKEIGRLNDESANQQEIIEEVLEDSDYDEIEELMDECSYLGNLEEGFEKVFVYGIEDNIRENLLQNLNALQGDKPNLHVIKKESEEIISYIRKQIKRFNERVQVLTESLERLKEYEDLSKLVRDNVHNKRKVNNEL